MSYSDMKIEYENTKTSFAKLSKKYNIHYKRIERYAKKNKWIKFNPTTVQKTMNIIIKQDEIKKPFLKELEEELEILFEELITYSKHQKDLSLIESYMVSYKLFKVYENEIDFNNIASVPIFYLQQLQIQQNNLLKLEKEIREMEWRNKNNR